MDSKSKTVRVAVVQAAPVIMDRRGTLEKALDLMETCGKENAKIVVFPEAFIPAYPRGLTFGAVVGSRSPEGRKDFRRYFENSVGVPSDTTAALGEAAKKYGAFLVMGVIEREGGDPLLHRALLRPRREAPGQAPQTETHGIGAPHLG